MAEAGPVVLEASKVLDAGDLARILPLVAGPSHKYGETRIFPCSAVIERNEGSVQPVFLHSIAAGLVPPFSDFFLAILTHYDIHLLHLQPNSITILSIFAFFCEAFLGVMPSVALFRHFYNLRCTAPGEISGSVSSRLEPSAAGSLIPKSVLRKAVGAG